MPGYLDWGDVRFTIKTITFSGGKMHVTATAGATEAGQVKGRVIVLGTDALPALPGRAERGHGRQAVRLDLGVHLGRRPVPHHGR